jgi:hypothetical protein
VASAGTGERLVRLARDVQHEREWTAAALFRRCPVARRRL